MSTPSGAALSGPKDSIYDSGAEGGLYSPSGDSDYGGYAFSDPVKIIEELKPDLTEKEITFRQVLSTKLRHLHELKRKVGIAVWTEFKDDMQQGNCSIQESEAFQKVSQTLKTAGDKKSEAPGSHSASVPKKFGEVRSSSAFKNIEDKVEWEFSSI